MSYGLNFSKFIKWLLMSVMVVTFTACGSSSNDTGVTNQQVAVAKIMQYSNTDGSSTAPTVLDYTVAGVTGVTADNLDEVNEVVAGLTPEDVNTPEKIQAIVDDLGIALPPPVITLNGVDPMTITLGDIFTDPGATATDATGANVPVTATDNVDTSKVGTYTVTYTAVDSAGSSTTAIRTVNVVAPPPGDTTPPVITLLGTTPVDVSQGSTYTDAGATATDDVDGDITAKIVTVNPVDTTTLGTYTVTYNVSDAAGNAATEVTRTVNVVAAPPPANQPPVVDTPIGNQNSVDGDTINMNISGNFSDPDGDTLTYSATNLPAGLSLNADSGLISGTISNSGSPYSVTITANDGNGGTVDDLFTWTVDAPVTTEPTAVSGPDQTVATGATVTLDGSNSSSNPSGHTLTYAWSQEAGTIVTLDDPASSTPTFTAPDNDDVLEFSLVVTDGTLDSAPDTVEITVIPVTATLMVSAGDRHTAEIRPDGTLWTWGRNNNGQLGDGTTTDSSIPIEVDAGPGLHWVSVSTGGDSREFAPHKDVTYTVQGYTVAIKSDGTLWSWGSNNYGQLGNGSTTDSNVPVQESTGATDWVSVSAGDSHTSAIRDDGTNRTLWTWGRNNHGQLGNGSTTDSNVPVQESTEATDWVTVSSGGDDDAAAGAHLAGHTAAIRGADGNRTLWSWGLNIYGQLGDGTENNSSSPVQEVTGATDWVSVSAGDSHTVAIRDDGTDRTFWSWGWNVYGQLGNGNRTNRSTPGQEVGQATDWDSVSAGSWHTIAIRDNDMGRTLWTWGRNQYGQLGLGDKMLIAEGINSPSQEITEATDWGSVSGGGHHSIAIKADGTLWIWGDNEYGQLGNSTTTDKHVLTRESEARDDWGSVSGGGNHTVTIRNDHTIWSWGYNQYGQLGNASQRDRTTPVQEQQPNNSSENNWVSITAGYQHTAAIKDDGSLWAWGANDYGQIGVGLNNERHYPRQESTGVTNWKSVHTGGWHTIGIKINGELWIWGRNNYGQLGLGSTDDDIHNTPVHMQEGDDWVTASASDNHSAAIRGVDGNRTLWAWGRNLHGQLGNGSTIDSNVSIQESTGATNWASVSASDTHTVAIREDGSLWAWGWNSYGQVGNGTTGGHIDDPVHITAEGDDWKSVSTGDNHTVAIKTDGTLWAWGRNNHGQLCDGTTVLKNTPTQIGIASNWVSVSGGDYFTAAINENGQLWLCGDNDYGQVHKWVTEPTKQ